MPLTPILKRTQQGLIAMRKLHHDTKMLKFISLGSGSSGNCYFLFTNSDGIIIDCGIGLRAMKKFFVEYGMHTSSIKRILVTHDHADHVKSVGSLSIDKNLPVYTTEEVHMGITRNWCVRKKIEQHNRMNLIKDVTIELGDFRITPFDVPHDSTDNVGYKIEHDGVVFVLVTDCGTITEEIGRYISEANYLVIEANHDPEMLSKGPYPKYLKNRIVSCKGHLCNEDSAMAVIKYATPKLRHVWLCHLSEENNHPELARKTYENVLRNHGIIAGADFKLDVLKRKAPTGVFELE